ncbi:acyl-CoA dehydrogenase family protein [Flavimaricola marinus]|uniref:Acyl-CoA dehydrogenase n=1 Tax=Flavimaricola marinus TaxID=1819565 RepID=A0A238LDC0_9RHOB|nr:acyl-CoA dehydrogenase family protein [Flavimaricola marinus]SMY06920.1 Acyl-CoA dehydrogenase [Flavimaricola marinus]
MIPFRAPLDDIAFSLRHVADVPDWDAELSGEIAAHFASFAEAELAPLNAVGDAQGARLENGRVRMPDGFKAAYAQFAEQGWPGLTAPEAHGGQEMDSLTQAAVSEIYSGANHAMQMVTGLVPGAIGVLMRYGTPEQQAQNIPPLVSGEWLSTMALTEAGAGSDLSRIRCKAERTGDTWSITGEKIFISGGDQNMSRGILHLVLARSGDDGLGGLSLFLCRSERADRTRNAVTVTRIEEKLGIHASPTCQLSFDGAEAELIGAEGAGLAAMFTMMNHARLDVALQGVAHAARATDIARTYAAERVQGRGLTLDQHPDVARMLDQMDMLAVGARGIAHFAMAVLERGDAPDLLEALTPVAKYFCTEAATEAADLGIQVLGGYGYLEEYGLAQIWRDARICRIYEGANGIHALALATRLLRQKAPLDALDAACAGPLDGTPMLYGWRRARDVVEAADAPAKLADGFMQVTAELVNQLVWHRIDAAASQHPDTARMQRLAARASRRSLVALAKFNAI